MYMWSKYNLETTVDFKFQLPFVVDDIGLCYNAISYNLVLYEND